MGGFLVNPNLLATEGFFGGASGGGGTSFQVPGIVFGSTGPSFNGPGQTFDAGGGTTFVIGTPSGFTGGSIVPDPSLIGGALVVAFGNFSTAPGNIPPFGIFFMLILDGGALPQNQFAALDFSTSNPVQTWHLTSAAAQFNNPWNDTATPNGYSTWVWPNNLGFADQPVFTTPIVVT